MMDNSPRWIEIDIKGETTGHSYFGRFAVKPFLTHGERADAQRIADRYTSGMEQTEVKNLLRVIAFLTIHIKEADAAWWKNNGLDLMDEAPIYEIAKKLDEIRNPPEEKSEAGA